MDEGTLRAGLGQWRAAHPRATFEEIEDEVYRQLAHWHAALVGELAQPEAGERTAGERPRCAACGAGLRPCGRRGREVGTRMGAATRLEREYWVCPACGAGVFPPG